MDSDIVFDSHLVPPAWASSDWVGSSEVSSVNGDVCSVASESPDEDGKFLLHGVYAYVTWSQSRIDDHEEFFNRLRAILPQGTEIFGGRELHQDGHSHYHVVMHFPRRVHWSDARTKLMVKKDDGDVDTKAIRIEVPRLYEPVCEFLDRTQAYCAKDDNPWLFGERILPISSARALRNRKFKEIIDEPDRNRAEQMIIDHDPYEYVMKHRSIEEFLQTKTGGRRKAGRKCARRFDPSSWRVPDELLDWKRRNVDEPGFGRRKALVLIGPPGIGKTKWAESFGQPIVMSKKWNLAQYREEATHVVVNDADALHFGAGGDSYWREVLGCQEEFSASDRYRPTQSLFWDFPCIWTCNEDFDPRKYKEVADYLQLVGATVVELTVPLFLVDSLCVQRGVERSERGRSPPLRHEKRCLDDESAEEAVPQAKCRRL
jgi:hypothetical protein